MSRHRIDRSILLITLGFGLLGSVARASQPASTTGSVPEVCATLESASGDVQILDTGRSRLLESLPGSALPCESWVSVGPGVGRSWAVIRHRDGTTFHAAAGTFISIRGVEQITLFRGQVLGRTEGATPTVTVVTANSRVKTQRGMILVNYAQGQEQTQVIALEGGASIENRFVPSGKVQLREGEGSTLDFKLMRTVPSAAQAVSESSLRLKLDAFPINDRIHSVAVKNAFQRGDRKFASTFDDNARAAQEIKNRAPASSPDPLAEQAKEKVRQAEAQKLDRHLRRKIAGGAPVPVRDTEAEFTARKKASESAEKKRLLEELQKLKP